MRRVNQQPKFLEDVKSVAQKYPRTAQAIEGVIWVLERAADRFPMVFVDYAIRKISLGDWPDIPPAHVYFQVRGDTVDLMYLQIDAEDPYWMDPE